MSFPYTLDLSFGSEKATADSFGRVSFGASGGEGTKIPTNVDELNALVESGKAVNIETQFGSKILEQYYVWPSSEDPTILGFVGVLDDVVTSLPVIYSTKVERGGGYCFTEAHQGNIGESALYVIYK